MKAMIFAAGLGTRLMPLTKNLPKALVKIQGKPLLEHVILKLKAEQITDFVINIHHFADKIRDFCTQNDNFGCNIQFSDETKMLLETGGGLKKAKPLLAGNQPIVIYNADIISDIHIQELLAKHKENKAIATLAMRTSTSDRKLVFDENNCLCKWENTKTKEVKLARKPVGKTISLAFSGIQIIEPQLINLITEKGKFSIIDIYLRLAKKYKIAASIPNLSYWFDAGKLETLQQARLFLKTNRK